MLGVRSEPLSLITIVIVNGDLVAGGGFEPPTSFWEVLAYVTSEIVHFSTPRCVFNVAPQGFEPRTLSKAGALWSLISKNSSESKTHDFHMIAQELCWDT